MEVENINTLDDAERFVEGCINDLEAGLAWKSETMKQFARYTGRLQELAYQKYLPIIEAAFVSGRSQTSWEQFKKDHNL